MSPNFPGSRHARMAWLRLRGATFFAYLCVFALTFTIRSDVAFLDGWQLASTTAAAGLIIGAVASYGVVANWKGVAWAQWERMEYPALLIMAFLEGVHGAWSAVALDSSARGWTHMAVALLLFAEAANMGRRMQGGTPRADGH